MSLPLNVIAAPEVYKLSLHWGKSALLLFPFSLLFVSAPWLRARLYAFCLYCFHLLFPHTACHITPCCCFAAQFSWSYMHSCISPTKSNLRHDPSARRHDDNCNYNYFLPFCRLLKLLTSRSSCSLPGKCSSLAFPAFQPFFCLWSHYHLTSFRAKI